LDKRQVGHDRIDPEEIVFEDVYPLYGAYDIRSSSILRNEAIRADTTQQLELATQALGQIAKEKYLPIFDEIVFRIRENIKQLQDGLITDDGETARRFLKQEVEPLLKKFNDPMNTSGEYISQYFNSLDNPLFSIQKRSEFLIDSVYRLFKLTAFFVNNS
jgi:hypothetical protein